MITAFLIPHFPTAIEALRVPAPPDGPLILLDDRQRVWAVSAAAARLGVQVGMKQRQAAALAPKGVMMPAFPARVQQARRHIQRLLAAFTHLLEVNPSRHDLLVYLDLEQLPRPAALGLARQMGQLVRAETGLAPQIGLAANKFTARVAAQAVRPHRVLVVAPGEEARFLAPFPIDLLPLDDETRRRLDLLGLHTLGQLAGLTHAELLNQFGPLGGVAWRLANGLDEDPVQPAAADEGERCQQGFEDPLVDEQQLRQLLQQMAQALAARLQAQGLAARVVGLKVMLGNGEMPAKQRILHQPTASAAQFGHHLQQLLWQMALDSGVMSVEVSVHDLVAEGAQQLSLLPPTSGEADRLQETLADLIARYGSGCFYQITLADPAARLPEAQYRWEEKD